MPVAFLAHQAVVLPIRFAAGRSVSGTALVLGSMAPDAEYVIRTYPTGTFGHSWTGQVAFCLPLTLALYAIVTRLVAPAVAANLPDGRPGGGGARDVVLLAAPGRRVTPWTAIAASALVGSVSHLLLDRAETAVVGAGPLEGPVAAPLVAQIGISLILAAIAVRMFRTIARRDGGGPPPAGRPWNAFWPVVVAITILGGAAGGIVRRPGFFFDEMATWVHIALAAVAAGLVGLVCVSVVWGARARRMAPAIDSGIE